MPAPVVSIDPHLVSTRLASGRESAVRDASLGGSMDSDHKQYDNPEPEDVTRGRAAMFIIGAIVVIVLLYVISTGKVSVWG
jgi:hypothetical protein